MQYALVSHAYLFLNIFGPALMALRAQFMPYAYLTLNVFGPALMALCAQFMPYAYLSLNVFGPALMALRAQFISYLAIVLNSITLFCPTCMKGDLQEKKNSNDTEARAGDLDAIFSLFSWAVTSVLWPSLLGPA